MWFFCSYCIPVYAHNIHTARLPLLPFSYYNNTIYMPPLPPYIHLYAVLLHGGIYLYYRHCCVYALCYLPAIYALFSCYCIITTNACHYIHTYIPPRLYVPPYRQCNIPLHAHTPFGLHTSGWFWVFVLTVAWRISQVVVGRWGLGRL